VFAQADAQALSFQSASVDRMLCVGVLYHVLGCERALREMRRVLRDGGRAVISTNGAYAMRRIAELHAEAAREHGHEPLPIAPGSMARGGTCPMEPSSSRHAFQRFFASSVDRKRAVAALTASGLLLAAGGTAIGQQSGPPAPPPVIETRIEAPGLDGPRDMVQRMLVLPPGVVVPPHTHPGPNFNTLVDGDVTLIIEGTEQPHHAGDTWIEPADVVHFGQVGPNGARLITATLVPATAPQSVPADAAGLNVPSGPPPPPALIERRIEALDVEGGRDVINDLLVYPPGVVVAPHTHPGPNFVTLIAGQITLTRPDSDGDTVYDAPTNWVEQTDELHWAMVGDDGATLFTSTIVPRGGPRGVPAVPPQP
jgi:quercetin dioxygenase-like cupin family protein